MLSNRRKFLKTASTTAAGLWLGGKANPALSSHLEDISKINSLYSGAPDDEPYWKFLRKQFPLTFDRVYFNTGGLGASPYYVIDKVQEKSLELERMSETGHANTEVVTEKIAHFTGADTDEIGITNNATHGINIIARGLDLKKGDEILTTTHEHPGGAIPWLGLVKDKGITVKVFEPGKNDEENLKLIELIRRSTKIHYGKKSE